MHKYSYLGFTLSTFICGLVGLYGMIHTNTKLGTPLNIAIIFSSIVISYIAGIISGSNR